MAQETFSDAAGYFRSTELCAGPVKVRAFFTGISVQATLVTVPLGGTAQHDRRLAFCKKGAGPIELAQYVVAESRQMEGAAIAINEQRFAVNLKTVVAGGRVWRGVRGRHR